jgi:hypothetical protein
MPVTASVRTQPTVVTNAHRLYASTSAGVNQREVRQKLDELVARGSITRRDERLLEYLREFNVLSLSQIHRLLWPNAIERTAYFRLNQLLKHHLLDRAPLFREVMTAWGLNPGIVYALGVGGRMWLRDEVSDDVVNRHLRQNQIVHDLLVAEFYVHLTGQVFERGEAWGMTVAGPAAASFYEDGASGPLIAPDALLVVSHEFAPRKIAALPLFVELDASREAHGRPSSAWGRKVAGFDGLRGLPWQAVHPLLGNVKDFPRVLVITHGGERLLNLAASILKHRRTEVVYHLGLWREIMASQDILTEPLWLTITPAGQVFGATTGAQGGLAALDPQARRPLLASPKAQG